jgi:hypothetical protein
LIKIQSLAKANGEIVAEMWKVDLGPHNIDSMREKFRVDDIDSNQLIFEQWKYAGKQNPYKKEQDALGLVMIDKAEIKLEETP